MLGIVCGCFWATMAWMSNVPGRVAHKAKNIYSLAFYQKRLPSPAPDPFMTSLIFFFPHERSFLSGSAFPGLSAHEPPGLFLSHNSTGLNLSEPPSQLVPRRVSSETRERMFPAHVQTGGARVTDQWLLRGLPVKTPLAADFLFFFCFRPYQYFICMYIF